jgi:hypothetical protein
LKTRTDTPIERRKIQNATARTNTGTGIRTNISTSTATTLEMLKEIPRLVTEVMKSAGGETRKEDALRGMVSDLTTRDLQKMVETEL